MNIVTPIPTTIVFTTGNFNTEAARRDNLQRETIPATTGAENSASESGVGSESDRVRTPGQAPQLTYERPQVQSNPNAQNNPTQGELFNQDNAEDPSAGRENAESRQEQQQREAQQQEVAELKSRDREVRSHEQAHAAVGGQYAGAPSYEFENGPDGQQYAVGGEVSIDISSESTPEETIRKMQQVRAAALAPADPSPQDLRVAAEATQKATEARSDVAREKAEEAKQAVSQNFSQQDSSQSAVQTKPQGSPLVADVPDLDEIVDNIDPEPPTRSLDGLAIDRNDKEQDIATLRQLLENRDSALLRRVSVIEGFYQNVSIPKQNGLQQSA